MNDAFERLIGELEVEAPIARDDLIRALYALRIPRSLTAIVPLAREFRDWRERYPALACLPSLDQAGNGIVVIDRIADLDPDDETLSGGILRDRANSMTPLRPYTGDSVLGESLLIRKQGDGPSSAAFQDLAAWLLCQAAHFHAQHTSPRSYEDYLLSNGQRLVEQKHGSRLYSAFLAVRKLTETGNAAQLHALHALNLTMTKQGSVELTLLERVGRLAPGTERRRLRQYAVGQLGYSEASLEIEAETVHRVLPSELALLLTTVWGGELRIRARVRRSGGISSPRTVTRPEIRPGRRLTEVLARAEEDEIHAGTVLDYFPRTDDATCAEVDRNAADDDPDEAEQREPSFTVFLADSQDMLKGYYAAKGIQAALEYQNSQLPWAKCTLSRHAIDTVLELVARPGRPAEDQTDCFARLAIGLSLITGRSLAEVATPLIREHDATVGDEVPVAINRGSHRVTIRTAVPALVRKPSPSPFCHPRAGSLSLPMPSAWEPLLQSLPLGQPKRREKIVQHARRMLTRSPDEFRVTEKGVRFALLRELARVTGGDLGAQKAITDGAEANTQNIIHYASYDQARIAAQWHDAVEALVRGLPDQAELVSAGRVGAVHAFDMAALAEHFADIRTRIEKAEADEDWVRAFNLLTLYLAYWLGLGTAARKTRQPLPSIRLAEGWALVADKSRHDGSTDRLVPLTDALLAQIDAYVALASELSITLPALDPIKTTEHGAELQLRYIHRRDGVVAYQPKYQEEHEQLIPLPANWGRKVVRSESTGLPGRYRDAELGHWTRGRHPWDSTSTLNATAFRGRWLECQASLEARLGFEIVTVAGCRGTDRKPTGRPGPLRVRRSGKRPPQDKGTAAYTEDRIEELLREAGNDRFELLVDTTQSCDPGIGLELVRRAVANHKQAPVEQQRELADELCKFIRARRGIPIYTVQPRPMFSQKSMPDSGALRTLAYLEDNIFDAFRHDLEHLPPRPTTVDDSGEAAPGRVRQGRRVELGRLAMIAIWRLGLTRWPLVDAWLRALSTDTPILAAGDLRYMILRVPGETGRETMRRTVFLDSFTAAYITVERRVIREELVSPLFARRPMPNASSRRASVQLAVNKYLHCIRPGKQDVPLTAMTEAAVQWLMCHSAPVIASYSKAAFFTEDLDDAGLRRLLGLQPTRRSEAQYGDLSPATKEHEIVDSGLPADVAQSGSAIMSALTRHRSPYRVEWRRLIGGFKAASSVERLLQKFALWLLNHPRSDQSTSRFAKHEKRYYINRVQIVGHALVGNTASESDWRVIDSSVLSTLYELGRDHFPDRLNHGAWTQFHKFLNDPDADHGGFVVGKIGDAPERRVSAKLLTRPELLDLSAIVRSAKSGIGNASLRISAQRHLDLMATFGLRRSESAHLRSLDWQGDLLRVQAHGAHGLKTPWADRALPIGFAEPDTRDWMRKAVADGQTQLVDPEPDNIANPDSFHDAVNKLIKRVTQDESMGSHHLRHTLASRLTATLLRDAAGLDSVFTEFPWLQDLLVSDERMEELLGTEGDGGQGLRAVAALMGHSHPSTTLTHYIHILCVALYSTLRGLDTLDVSRSFEQRVASRATVQRWVRSARVEAAIETDRRLTPSSVNQSLRDRIESHYRDAGIDRDETPLGDGPVATPDDAVAEDDVALRFERIESIDRSLRDGQYLVERDLVEQSRRGLARLAAIPSGRKGAKLPRHPLVQNADATWLPAPLPSGTATIAASKLCSWLENVRVEQPSEFDWLLDKWVHASERERGRMRLDDQSEIARAEALGDDFRVDIDCSRANLSASRAQRASRALPRMRIHCLDGAGEPIKRDTLAIRWVMSHVAARVLDAGDDARS